MTVPALRNLLPATSVEVAITETGWQPLAAMSFEQWEAAGQDLLRMGRAWQWWVGDWVLYGEHAYGDMYTQALDATGLEYKTLRNVIAVCRAVELSRRRDNLSFTHHAEVAALPPVEQDEWLDRAVEDGMTTERLRSALSKLRRGEPPEPEPEPAATFVAEISVVYAADDLDGARVKVDDLAKRLERHGVSVTRKHVQARHR